MNMHQKFECGTIVVAAGLPGAWRVVECGDGKVRLKDPTSREFRFEFADIGDVREADADTTELAGWREDYVYPEPDARDYNEPLYELAERWAAISSLATGHGWPDPSMMRLHDVLEHLWRHIVDAPIQCSDDADGKLRLIRAWIADEGAAGGSGLSDDVITLERQIAEFEGAVS